MSSTDVTPSREHVLAPLCKQWLRKIKDARKVKWERFGQYAVEGMKFYDSAHDWMWKEEYSKGPSGFLEKGSGAALPTFRMQVNRIFEAVALFGPALYHRNPDIMVTPVKMPAMRPALMGIDPQNPQSQQIMQQIQMQEQMQAESRAGKAELKQHYLNWLQVEGDKKTHARRSITEAIVKGMGVLWCLSGGTHVYARFHGQRHAVVRVRDLYRSPDHAELWDGVKWQPVVAVTKKQRVGNELQLRTRNGERINCTPEHRWPTGRGVLRADQLSVGDILLSTQLPEPADIHVPAHVPDDIGWLVGLVVADGHLEYDRNRFTIAGHKKETSRRARLDAIASDYGATIFWRTSDEGEKMDATIISPVLCAIVGMFINGSHWDNKCLSGACWERSNEFLRQVLDGYLAGDGHYIEKERMWKLGFGLNHLLASSLRTLCARLGLRISLYECEQQWNNESVTVYRGSIDLLDINQRRWTKNRYEIVEISPADHRCDYYYDITLPDEPHLFALASGVLSHNCEIYQPNGSPIKYPWSHHISIDDIVIDPDAEYWEDVQWIARYCCHPVNLVERQYSLRDKSLKGHMQSAAAQGDIYGAREESSRKRRHGRSFDLCEHWLVYSKNGFGDRLRKSSDNEVKSKFDFEPFGDFCKIVVAENVPYPLNMPTDILKTEGLEQLFERAQWEVPYWEGGGWPGTFLSFYDKPRCVWPVSIVKPAVGELRFVNWCMSFLADKVAASCTTYIAVAKQAGMEIQNQLQNGMAPYTVIEISQITGRSISDVVSFLDAPSFSADIWKMLSEVMVMIDKRTGLTDLIYGMTDTQLRSATEASVKEQNTNIRPDDMASRVEDFLSETALNEMAAAVWSCEASDMVGVLGEMGAQVWEQQIKTQDFGSVVHDYDYRVAAGSARKPNKNTKQRALTELGQVILPTLQEYAQQGVVEPWNAYISEICKTMDIDPDGFLLQPPQGEEGPSPEEQMAQMEMQKMQLEMQMKQQEFQMKQQAAQAELVMKQQAEQAALQAQQETAQVQLMTEREKAAQEMQQAAMKGQQELQQGEQMSQQELMLERARLSMLTQENAIKLEGLKAMNEAKLAATRAQAAIAKKNAAKPTPSKSKE